MSLETRVDTQDVALLQAETRGWATFAVAADRKSNMNAELLSLIYRDVSEMKAALLPDVAELKTDVAGLKTDVAGLKTDVAGLKTDVAGLKTDVAGHGEILREHSATLQEHGEMLREILARLA
jgi:hypothetical protein